MTVDENVQNELAHARRFAEEGEVAIMEGDLREAQRYAGRTGLDISSQVAEIEGVGYRKAVPVKLARARTWADKGLATAMESCLISANECARRVEQDISSEVSAIEGVGYRNAVPLDLKSAREFADIGKVTTMGNHLRLAQRYANKIGQDISSQVAEIEGVGYRNSV